MSQYCEGRKKISQKILHQAGFEGAHQAAPRSNNCVTSLSVNMTDQNKLPFDDHDSQERVYVTRNQSYEDRVKR